MILADVEWGWLAILIASPALALGIVAILRIKKIDKKIQELESKSKG